MDSRLRTPTELDKLADRLRWTREARGLNQATFGRLVDISAQAWNNYETARQRISLDQAIKLCTAVPVSLDWIYRGDMSCVGAEFAVKLRDAMAQDTKVKRRA